MDDLTNIIESLLFAADEPLGLDRLRSVIPHAAAADIREALNSLAEEYETRQGGFHLREVAGGFQIRTRPEYGKWVKELVKPNPLRLSKAALETLAIIAYNQPVIRSDIEHIRGVDCGGTLRMLMERKLVRVLGRKEIPGRPLIYATTKFFLELFNLKNLKDLPSPKEIEEHTAPLDDLSPEGLEPTGITEGPGPMQSQPTAKSAANSGFEKPENAMADETAGAPQSMLDPEMAPAAPHQTNAAGRSGMEGTDEQPPEEKAFPDREGEEEIPESSQSTQGSERHGEPEA